jgi:hypothetical protein
MDKLRTVLFVIGFLGAVLTVVNFSVCRWGGPVQPSSLAWCGGWPDFTSWYEKATYSDYFPVETSLLLGDYAVYSVSQSEDVWDSEAEAWTTTNDKTIYRYRIESGEKEILKTPEDPTKEFYSNGFYLTSFNGQTWEKLGLDGYEGEDQEQFIYSNNGKFSMTSEDLDLGSGEMPVARDGLSIKVFDKNDNLMAAPEVVWQDVGCDMAEAGTWFISDDGQRIYVYGRTADSSSTNVFWQYSLANNEWQEVVRLKNDLENFSWYDINTELITVFSYNQNGVSQAYGIDLKDGKEYDLWTGENSDQQIQWTIWSPDTKTVLLAGDDECVFEVPIGGSLADSGEVCDFEGAPLDLIGSSLIIDQAGKLKVLDLKTKESVILSEKEFTAPDTSSQNYEFLGVVKID